MPGPHSGRSFDASDAPTPGLDHARGSIEAGRLINFLCGRAIQTELFKQVDGQVRDR